MMNVSQFVTTDDYQEWLAAFFDSVERGRLGRGCGLYRSNAVQAFEETSGGGFYAGVSGSKGDVYEVRNYAGFDLAHGRLDEDWDIECSCPDYYVLCKHTICAVIYWAVMMDRRLAEEFAPRRTIPRRTPNTDLQFAWKLSQDNPTPQVEQPFAELELQLQSLVQHAKSSDYTLLNLGDAAFWTFKERLPRVMGDLHHIVEKNLTTPKK